MRVVCSLHLEMILASRIRLGLFHIAGFIAHTFDAVLDSNEFSKIMDLYHYETNPNEYDSPIPSPNVGYTPYGDIRDYTFGLKPIRYQTALINALPPKQKQLVVQRYLKVINENVKKMEKLSEKSILTPHEIEEFKQRFQSLQNMGATLIETNSVDGVEAQQLQQNVNAGYNILKKLGINVDYNNMLREKRELKK